MTTLTMNRAEATKPIDNSFGRTSVHLLGLGTAVPDLRWSQTEIGDTLAGLWKLSGGSLDRWQRIINGSGIEFRHGVMKPAEVINLSTAQRMAAYENFAAELAETAARNAIANCGIPPESITDLIVVTCTGFSAPGVDVELVTRLGLQPTVRRTVVGFMGCFGGIIGLRTAIGSCGLQPGAVALVVCVELCSLHIRADRHVQNQVASALFADGAAAAVLADENDLEGLGNSIAQPLGRVTPGTTRLIEEGRSWMSWRITDAGFAMTLTKHVPHALANCLGEIIGPDARQGNFAVHPGGPDILDAVDSALELRGAHGLPAAREILRRFGNMSSATVLFILQEILKRGLKPPITMLAFGPGLTVESMPLLVCGHTGENSCGS